MGSPHAHMLTTGASRRSAVAVSTTRAFVGAIQAVSDVVTHQHWVQTLPIPALKLPCRALHLATYVIYSRTIMVRNTLHAFTARDENSTQTELRFLIILSVLGNSFCAYCTSGRFTTLMIYRKHRKLNTFPMHVIWSKC